MLTTMVVADLRTSRMSDELKTAVRVVSSDLRSVRARAIGGENVKTCTSGSTKAVAEQGTTLCTDQTSLGYSIPSAVGMVMATGSAYELFADVDPAPLYANGLKNGAVELLFIRDLGLSGTPNVVIDQITENGIAMTPVTLAYRRQSGTMMLDGAMSSSAPKIVVITLRQTQSNETRTITIDQWSGQLKTQL